MSEFVLTVHVHTISYNQNLRLRKVALHSSTDDLLKSYCQVLNYGLLAMVSTFSDREEEEAVFHQKFVTGLQTLQAFLGERQKAKPGKFNSKSSHQLRGTL